MANKISGFAAGFAAVTVVVAACSSNASDIEEAAFTSLDACATRTYYYTKPESILGGMTITYDIAPEAVWEDGSPITVADFKTTWEASLNTPSSLSTSGYDQIISVEAGANEKQVIATFKSRYAAYKNLFSGLIKAAVVKNPSDVSNDFLDVIPFSGRPYKMESFSNDQIVLVANENYWGSDKAKTPKIVMVPRTDKGTAIGALKAGEVDFIFPQFFAGIEKAVSQDNISSSLKNGSDYEMLFFNSKCGPFADDVFRKAFSKSINREALFNQIYKPFAPSAELLECGPIVPGPYCNGDEFAGSYDPEGAAKIMEDAGWEKNADGYWSKDGVAPEIRWVINTGNTRRESTQAYLIPLLQAAGFNVKADNCDASCFFQKRVPALDYDLAMYIASALPDPSYLTKLYACDQIPTDANDFKGKNTQGWCNAEASDLMHAADLETDPIKRAGIIKSVLQLMADDHAILPLFQWLNSGFWRIDKVSGPIDSEFTNFRKFQNFNEWLDIDGDGKIVIGVEQWPACLNPVTECASSSWLLLTAIFPVMPGAFTTTSDGNYRITNLLSGEPVVKVL